MIKVTFAAFGLWSLLYSCLDLNIGGPRRGGGTPPPEISAPLTGAAILGAVDQQGVINAAVQSAVDAAFLKFEKGNAGRDINTFDSPTSWILAGGVIVTLWDSVRTRRRASASQNAEQTILQALRSGLVGEPCDPNCGQCADCIAAKLPKNLVCQILPDGR